jgi:hypothetical protein
MKNPNGSPLLAAVVLVFCLQTSFRLCAQPTNDVCTNAIEMAMDTVDAIDPEFTTNLTPPVFWTNVPRLTGGTYKDGNYFVTSSIPGNSIFYRLKK